MKVTIKITEHGYTKSVKMKDGTNVVEKWIRSDNGFSQTDDSFQFDNSDVLLPETIEALGCDFELSAICDAIENENAEIWDDEPAVTDDGHTLQRGDEFWTVAATTRDKKWLYIPIRMKFPKDWGSHGSTCYQSREKCIEECDKRNGVDVAFAE